ncbi:MAG: peptidase S41, partial [Flavobacteriales bacterium]
DYYDDYFNRLESGELLDPEKIKVHDSLKFKTPKGKIVYGGGGIIPDVFVPIDNSMQNETLSYIQHRGYIANFAFEILEKDRRAYEGMPKQDFIENFEVTDDMVLKFQNYLNVRTGSKITFVAYNDEVKQYIKATLADQLYGNGSFDEILNQKDVMVEEVIKLSEEGF